MQASTSFVELLSTPTREVHHMGSACQQPETGHAQGDVAPLWQRSGGVPACANAWGHEGGRGLQWVEGGGGGAAHVFDWGGGGVSDVKAGKRGRGCVSRCR